MMIGDLIAKLEAATEGSPELDALIWCVLNGKKFKEAGQGYDGAPQAFYTEPPKRTQLVSSRGDVKPWTRSLDAALTLVGDTTWNVGRLQKYENIPSPIPFAGRPICSWVGDGKTQWGATPALALTIAALKARQVAA